MKQQHGITILSGLKDWQIIQRDSDGNGHLELKGLWKNGDNENSENFHLYISVVHASSGEALSPAFRNRKFPVNADGTWSASIAVPVAGYTAWKPHCGSGARRA